MRDLLVFLVVMLSMPMSFQRPFIGLLVFSWLAYMRPQDLCWGFARNMRLSFYVGLAMVVGWWAFERGRRPFTVWDVRTRLMVVLTVLVALSYGMAKYQTAYFNRYFFEYLKIVLVALFTAGQVDSRQRFRWMAWTIALCLGFYGIKGGLFGILTGGATILRGPGGMLEDNNDFALALVMNVPLLWYLGHNERDKPLVRLGTRIGVVLTTVTVVLTLSRGAFLALTGTALWISWRSGRLLRACTGLAVAALAFVTFAPQRVFDRLSTIGDTGESSAAARLVAWRTAMRMIQDNPWFGVGMRNFQPRYLDYAQLPPTASKTTTYVAHNSYLQIWAESGTLAFGVYVAMLLSVLVACRRIYRLAAQRPDLHWVRDYARMMEATTIAFMIGATFLNRGHFDLVYHWLALVTSLVAVSMHGLVRAPRRSAERTRPGITVRRRPVLAAPARGGPRPSWGRAT